MPPPEMLGAERHGGRRRRVLPIIPRKFERASHSATPSISRSDTSASNVAEPVQLGSAVPVLGGTTLSTPADHELAGSSFEKSVRESSVNHGNETNDAVLVEIESSPVFHRSIPSVDLNITFGEFSPSAVDHLPAPVNTMRPESGIESHVMTPTGSTTSYTNPTPFTQSEIKISDNITGGEKHPGHGNGYHSFGPEIPEGRAGVYCAEDDLRRLATTQQPHLGAFNPVVNGVPLVHNLLLSFNQPLLSDLTLHISAPNYAAPLHVHSIVVTMLPPIQDAISQIAGIDGQPKTISLRCSNPYATFEALEAVVRMPYGGSLPIPPRTHGSVPDMQSWAQFHLANLAAASFLRYTEVADMSADGLIPLMERNLSIAKKALECIYADGTQFDPNAPPGHYRDPIKNGRFYHFKLFEAAKAVILASMVCSDGSARTLDYAAPAAPLLGGFPPAASPVNSTTWRERRVGRSGLSVGEVVLGPDEMATTLSTILLSVPAGFLNLLTRDSRAELMLGASIKEREDRRKAFVLRSREDGLALPDRGRWEERYEMDPDGFPAINRYEVIPF